MAKSASARRAAKAAKAEARRKEAEAKRAARAQARVTKQAEAEANQALISVKASEVETLVAELKLLVDNACDHFAYQMREAAELSSRLRDDFGLTQVKIGAAIGRSQAWVSMILKWKEAGFPDTAFGPQSKARDVGRLSGPDNPSPPASLTEPDAEVGPSDLRVNEGQPHRVGPTVSGDNDVDVEASAERRKAMSEPLPWDTSKWAPTEFKDTAEALSTRTYAAGKSWLDDNLKNMHPEARLNLFDYFKFHPMMVGLKRKAA